MKKGYTIITLMIVTMSLLMCACGNKVTANKYEGKKEVKENIEQELPEETSENSKAKQKEEEENSEAYQEAKPHEEENKEESSEPDGEQDSEQVEEDSESDGEQDSKSDDEQAEENSESDGEQNSESVEEDEDYIPNGAISDRKMSMGVAYIGRKLTLEEVVDLFSDLKNYENNELTAAVANKAMEYLNETSEYDMINLWENYSELTQEERYAMIVLTKYKQDFGGYSASKMKAALDSNETYKADTKSIGNDLK